VVGVHLPLRQLLLSLCRQFHVSCSCYYPITLPSPHSLFSLVKILNLFPTSGPLHLLFPLWEFCSDFLTINYFHSHIHGILPETVMFTIYCLFPLLKPSLWGKDLAHVAQHLQLCLSAWVPERICWTKEPRVSGCCCIDWVVITCAPSPTYSSTVDDWDHLRAVAWIIHLSVQMGLLFSKWGGESWRRYFPKLIRSLRRGSCHPPNILDSLGRRGGLEQAADVLTFQRPALLPPPHFLCQSVCPVLVPLSLPLVLCVISNLVFWFQCPLLMETLPCPPD
jgi:hypothetical protein